MSAYQVGTDTIDLIVSAAIETDYHGDPHRRSLTVYLRADHVVYTEAAQACITLAERGRPLRRFETFDGNVIGRELIAANAASVAARYPNDTVADRIGGMIGYLPDDYTYRRVMRDRFADYGHLFGALACYEYQACETGEPTLAEAICDRVRRDAAMRIFDRTGDDHDGFRSWDWSRADAETARQAIRERIKAGSR